MSTTYTLLKQENLDGKGLMSSTWSRPNRETPVKKGTDLSPGLSIPGLNGWRTVHDFFFFFVNYYTTFVYERTDLSSSGHSVR